MISEVDLLGLIEENKVDMSVPIQQLFDECLNFISVENFE